MSMRNNYKIIESIYFVLGAASASSLLFYYLVLFLALRFIITSLHRY